MNKAGTIKSILIVVILLLVVVLGVLGLNTVKTYIGGASADTQPKNVLGTPNDDGKSATITWTSDKPLIGVVEYGSGPAALLLRAPESESTTTHSVVLSPLKSGTSYYFRIRIGEEVFDNNGIPYSFKTKQADIAKTVSTAPVAVPTVAPLVTSGAVTTECIKGADTMEYINCLRKKPSVSTAPVVTVAQTTIKSPAGVCSATVDYNKDGVINSLDRIKCLQNK